MTAEQVFFSVYLESLERHFPLFIGMLIIGGLLTVLAREGLTYLALSQWVTVWQGALYRWTVIILCVVALAFPMAWLAEAALLDASNTLYARMFFIG